ncbi:MAG: M48 family metallopeptidase [Bacteroidota bacterium]
MNTYALIILCTLLAEFFLHLIADILNLRALNDTVPREFDDVFDTEKYRTSQQYTRTTTRFGFLTSTIDIIILLLFWFAGGFNVLDTYVRSFHLHFIWSGLLYVGILILCKSLLTLPFSIYATFVIEERFGFNKTTPKIFILDLCKGVLLGILLGGPLFAGVLAFFQFAGANAWLYCWGLTILFLLTIQFIAPTWIMPLFNTFTPLENSELRENILSYAKSVNFSLQDVFIMDGSKRSTKSNAFFTGFGKNKRIALFDTLIASQSTDELVAILAHEIGHYKKKHILQGVCISILHTGIMFFLLSLFISDELLFTAFYVEEQSLYAGMIFFGMLFSPLEYFMNLAMNILSRNNEFAADAFAKETTQQPDNLISALKKLSADNLSNLTPHPFYAVLNYSHPPVLERIHALRK